MEVGLYLETIPQSPSHSHKCVLPPTCTDFSAKGFNTYAVSLRAQGGSDCISNDKDTPIVVAGTLDSHAKDLGDLIAEFPQAPVVIGHS